MSQTTGNMTLTGQGISAGISEGKAFIYRPAMEPSHEVYCVKAEEVKREYCRIEEALSDVIEGLRNSETKVLNQLDDSFGQLLNVHQEMLKDPTLIAEIEAMLKKTRLNAEFVVTAIFRKMENSLRQANDTVFVERADDVCDLHRQVLRRLSGQETLHPLANLPDHTVVVAKRLLPSDTVHFMQQSVRAVVVEQGSRASHTAILTNELGIPAVSDIDNVLHMVPEHCEIIVDGTTGKVVIEPDVELKETYRLQRANAMHRQMEVRRGASRPAIMQDDTEVTVMANISTQDDARLAINCGADGVGLYRLEQLYFGQESLPTEEELFTALQTTIEPFDRKKPITLRLLDTGGDKPLPYLDYPFEETPVMGRRGVRFLLAFPDLLATQLRSFLRLSKKQNIRILVPMVTLASDMRAARQLFLQCAKDLSCTELPPFGAMIETPAAALCAASIVSYCDFLSIGTNDLTQYTLAAGRENTQVADYFQPDHPAVLRLIQNTIQDAAQKPVAVCGELAAQVDVQSDLIALGIREVSVNPLQVPFVKETIRNINPRSTMIRRRLYSDKGTIHAT